MVQYDGRLAFHGADYVREMQHFLPNLPVTLSYRKYLSFVFGSRLRRWIPLLIFRRVPKSISEKWLLVSLGRSVFLSVRNWTQKWNVFVIFQILDLHLNISTHSSSWLKSDKTQTIYTNTVVGNINTHTKYTWLRKMYFLCSLVTELLTIHSPQSIVVILLENEENLPRKQ